MATAAVAEPAESLVELLAQPLADSATDDPKARKSTKRKRVVESDDGRVGDAEPTPVAGKPARTKRKYTFIKRKRAAGAVSAASPFARRRIPRAPPEVVGAATRWRMPPTELLHKRIPKAVAKYLELTRPEEFARYRAARAVELARRREIREREARLAQWLSHGTELPPYMLRERPPPPRVEIERPEPEIAAKVEKPWVRVYVSECKCGACTGVRQSRVTPQTEYLCRMERCRQKFRDIVAFVDHQIDAHATVNVHCKRARAEYFRTEVNVVYPPVTVFIVEQHVNATVPPAPWTMARVEQEKNALEQRLAAIRKDSSNNSVQKRFMRVAFNAAYERVQLYGLAELREQHRVALEHFEAALVFPVGPRNRRDVISAIGVGRNWLLSPEPENSEMTRVLKLAKRDDEMVQSQGDESDEQDEEGQDEEVVLLEFGGEHGKDDDAKTGVHEPDKVSATTEPFKEHEMHRATETPDVICI